MEKTECSVLNERKHLEGFFESLEKIERQKDSKSVFEWVDSPLVKAVENGHWVLIENVKLHFINFLIKKTKFCLKIYFLLFQMKTFLK